MAQNLVMNGSQGTEPSSGAVYDDYGFLLLASKRATTSFSTYTRAELLYIETWEERTRRPGGGSQQELRAES